MQKPKAVYLKDYRNPDFGVNSIKLLFELGENETYVSAEIAFESKSKISSRHLTLAGEELTLLELKLNDQTLSEEQYQRDATKLVIYNVPKEFTLTTKVKIQPQLNTRLSGLYKSNHTFCTQCEAEGFRRITYFLDQPDVLTYYTTTIIADERKYPILLSNGNLIEVKKLPHNKHSATWEDPFKKPSYLFALVAGNLDYIEDYFITQSQRKICLRVFTEKGNQQKAYFAIEALKKAMWWDEQTFAREYDLDIYMIVAVSDFNMGAMENKGLNIFNDKYILADPEIATDMDFENIMEVVGHEYFHNWSGNRITCRDWFQLSLKEGLTIFRDQEFTADMTSRSVKRITDARFLRTFQYPEDSGPMAHPVQPDSYIQIDNFYTHTVYEKGAEIIRMLQTLLGKEKFVKGMILYFTRYDGQAVTIEEFVTSMEEAGEIDLTQFRRWYKQAGTPIITVEKIYNSNTKTLLLNLQQRTPATPGQREKLPLHIPLKMAFLSSSNSQSKELLIELKNPSETREFTNIPENPILSMARDFSAPVIINYEYTDEELAYLMTKDNNSFSQWEACLRYIRKIFFSGVEHVAAGLPVLLPPSFIAAFQQNLLNQEQDEAFITELLRFPNEKYLLESLSPIDVKHGHLIFASFRKQLAGELQADFLTVYQRNYHNESYDLEYSSIAKRKLMNLALSYLALTDTTEMLDICFQQYKNANNMTNRLAAIQAIINSPSQQRAKAVEDFYHRYRHEPLVIDKWFTLQATADHEDTFIEVNKLTHHEAFTLKNPNKVRSLIGAFCMHNPYHFHREDGAGYEFLGDYILKLNNLNPQLAARLLEPLTHWKKYAEPQQNLMHKQLLRIQKEKLSNDVYEIVMKSLR